MAAAAVAAAAVAAAALTAQVSTAREQNAQGVKHNRVAFNATLQWHSSQADFAKGLAATKLYPVHARDQICYAQPSAARPRLREIPTADPYKITSIRLK